MALWRRFRGCWRTAAANPPAPHPASPREEAGRGDRSCGFPSPRPYGERPGEGRGELPAPVRPIPRAPHPASPREDAGRGVRARDMREPPVHRRLADGRGISTTDRSISSSRPSARIALSKRPMRRHGGGSRRFSTNSATNCRCCGRALRRHRRGRGASSRAGWRRRSRRSMPSVSSRQWRRSPARSRRKFSTAMTEAAPLARAYVNNGGDIALHLTSR